MKDTKTTSDLLRVARGDDEDLSAAFLTAEGHYTEATRLLWVIDQELQDPEVPRGLSTLALIAIGHLMASESSFVYSDPK